MQDAQKAIRDAVKAHVKDGLVHLYPTVPVGDVSIPGVPTEQMDVEPAEAERLLSFRPAAFTLYESGNPPKEHAELESLEVEQAWGVSDPEDAADDPVPSPLIAPPLGEQKPKES